MPSRHSVPHSAHAGAWCRPTGGSSGNGPGVGKQPYYLTLADDSPLSFAALWERWSKDGESLESFTIITTAASPALTDIHHRQPAIIDSDRFDDWLDPTSSVPSLLELAREPRAGPYERRAVSNRVNSVRNDDPGILVRVGEAADLNQRESNPRPKVVSGSRVYTISAPADRTS